MPSNASPSPTTLASTLDRLDHCPDCGYLLLGLEPGHRCPECGFYPEDGLVVLWGWAAGSRANAWITRPRGPDWKKIALAFLPLWFAIAIATRNWLELIIWGSIMIFPAIYYEYQLKRGFNRPTRPVQLRISPAGLAQGIGFAPVKFNPWAANFRLEWQQKNGQNTLRIKCVAESQIGIVMAGVCDFETDLPQDDQEQIRSRLSDWVTHSGGQINRAL